jgi:hypothetical protein
MVGKGRRHPHNHDLFTIPILEAELSKITRDIATTPVHP